MSNQKSFDLLPIFTSIKHSKVWEMGKVNNSITNDQVESIIRKWKEVQNAALGKDHQLDKLNKILEGRMLECWYLRSLDVKKKGEQWVYSLDSIQVEEVYSEDRTAAKAKVKMQEKAAYILEGKTKMVYEDEYLAWFWLVRKEDDSWRITDGR